MDWLTQLTHPSVEWNYAIITLVMRFIGVFIVLFFIQVALQLASRVVRNIEANRARKEEEAFAAITAAKSAAATAARKEEEEGLDSGTAAAIAMALELEFHPTRRTSDDAHGPTAWSIAGRMGRVRLH